MDSTPALSCFKVKFSSANLAPARVADMLSSRHWQIWYHIDKSKGAQKG